MKPAVLSGLGGFALGLCAAASPASAADPSKTEQSAAFHEQVQAAIQAGEAGNWVFRPVWTERPDGQDVDQTYPARAKARDISGFIVLACRVTAAGKLAPCEVTSEDPPGFGFGDGALQLAPLFKMKPLDAAGASVEGRLIRLPIAYRRR